MEKLGVSSKDELMMDLGALDEASKELEEVSENCEDQEEEVVGIFATIFRIIERVFLVTK